jgi:protocatechuate 3,4-dioxygenase beta subunit
MNNIHFTEHNHAEGLQQDLNQMQRRQWLRKASSMGMVMGMPSLLLGCGGGGEAASSSSSSSASSSSSSSSGGSSASNCSAIPSETAGPYPGDGTNTSSGATSNVLSLAGLNRQNITSSISGYGSGTATGVALTVNLTLNSVSSGCNTPLAGYAVYLWHCDALGRYSLYSSGVTGESYLRGLQVSDSNGQLSFTTIFPGCYSGRWPHVHFEIFSSLASATSGSTDIKTSQFALPQSVCSTVYGQSGYTSSASNLSAISLASDNIFNDGYSLQMADVTGSVAAGYAASLQISL